jgi:ribosome biogenesis GTPase A
MQVWQYVTLFKRVYLIDSPGTVPGGTRDSPSQLVLKVVPLSHSSSSSSHFLLHISIFSSYIFFFTSSSSHFFTFSS